MSTRPKGFVTPEEFGKAHDMSRQRVTKLIHDQRIKGVIREPIGRNNCWFIPKNAVVEPPQGRKGRQHETL